MVKLLSIAFDLMSLVKISFSLSYLIIIYVPLKMAVAKFALFVVVASAISSTFLLVN